MSFQFQQFFVNDSHCAMKTGTDSVLLGAWADVSHAATVVDLGAGCGLLSLMMAQRNDRAVITGIEIDSHACMDCMENFKASPWRDRLYAVCGDASAYHPCEKPELVISNPPFFDQTLRSPVQERALARHDGSLSPESVVQWAATHLSRDGSVALVLPASRTDHIIFIGEMLHLKEWRRLDICPKTGSEPQRTLLQLSRTPQRPQRGRLDIRTVAGKYTPEYRALTDAFYLHLSD